MGKLSYIYNDQTNRKINKSAHKRKKAGNWRREVATSNQENLKATNFNHKDDEYSTYKCSCTRHHWTEEMIKELET